MRYSNCLVFALRRWHKRGGYLIVRRSRFGWWWHFAHVDSLLEPPIAYVPERPIEWSKLPWLLRVLPLHTFVFRGRIQVGDDD